MRYTNFVKPTNVDPTFLLWNTITARQSHAYKLANGSDSDDDIGNTDTETSRPSHRQQQGRSSQPTQLAQPTQPQQPPQLEQSQAQLADGTEKYVVPVYIAAKCLPLLLDGSGFSVHKTIFQNKYYGAHHPILKRAYRKSLSLQNNGTDVANAIVVCDVTLAPNHGKTPSERYPYTEWYDLSSLKMLQKLHFDKMEPPSILTSSFLQIAKALLWNKNNYKQKSNRNCS